MAVTPSDPSSETAVTGPAEGPDPRRWRALAVLLTASLIDVVDVTIVNIAMPSIRTDTGASFSALQWISAGYALTFAIGLITGGRLGDIFGRKRIFLLGIAGFTLASALAALAASPEMLVGARLLQGVGAALMVPQVLSIIHVSFPEHERPKVFAVFGSAIALGALLGPLVGAVLTQSDLFGLGWRSVFLLNLPLGVAGLVVGSRLLTESRSPETVRIDPLGIVLVSAGLLMLLYPLTQGRELGWPVWTFVSMIGSLVVLVVFVRYESARSRREGSPLVELSLFSIPSFGAGIGVQLLVSLVSGIFMIGWTLYLQLGLGWSPLEAGLTGLPYALATAAAAGFAMQKLATYGRAVLQSGAVVMALGALLYAGLADHYGAAVTPWLMIAPLVVMGAGTGLIIAPLTNAALSQVPPRHAGSASGLINTANQLGLAIGLALASVAFFSVVDDAPAGQAAALTFSSAFAASLWWVAGGMVLAGLLMLALPRTTPAWSATAASPATDSPATDSPGDAGPVD